MISVVGLGPGDLDRVGGRIAALLQDPGHRVIVRTLNHPAAEQLAAQRPVDSCDDLYESAEEYDDLYEAVAQRVVTAAATGSNVVYAVPGSPLYGEFAVPRVRRLAADRGIEVEVLPAESFVDAVLAEVGYDPLDRGLLVLNGHDLPDPLILDHPTIVGHLHDPLLLGDVVARLGRVLPEHTEVVVLTDLGSGPARVVRTTIDRVEGEQAGMRTSLFLDPEPAGLVGAVQVMRRLRRECPWDRDQTHRSLLPHLAEETAELMEAVAALPVAAPGGAPDWTAYAGVEDELGDVLLQVLFHTVMAEEAGAFDIDDLAEALRSKLVRRHPHVFGAVEAGTPGEVLRNWEQIKAEERQGESSLMDGIPVSIPGLARAAKLQTRAATVGFDWPEPGAVLPKLEEEVGELSAALDDPAAAERELGDVLFSLVNLGRHLKLDPEVALRGAVARFERRFRRMEEMGGGLSAKSLVELDALWDRAKVEERLSGPAAE